ncbi:peptide ABC transporter permease [Clostridia bacterium]|nr:peptide ABC transporter permease [Clostridia bacterium]
MLKYVIKRIFYALLTIFTVTTLTFILMFLVPGGPFLSEKAPSQATIDALNEKYGLDKPKIVQYKNYVFKLIKGDLGVSLKQRGLSVNDIIKSGFPVSARIGGAAALIAIIMGILLGSLAAFHHEKFLDNFIILFSTLGIATPSFVMGTVLLIIFGVKLNWLPTFGIGTPAHHILPVLALSLYPTAYIIRIMRSSMLEVLHQDYIRTAKAKGVSQFKCIFKHALRNAVLPVITYFGPMLANLLTGSFVIEKIFTIPGIGNTFINSAISRDYPLIMGTTIFLAFLIVFINVAVDILYKIIDPHITLK